MERKWYWPNTLPINRLKNGWASGIQEPTNKKGHVGVGVVKESRAGGIELLSCGKSGPWENPECGTALWRYGHGYLWIRLRKKSEMRKRHREGKRSRVEMLSCGKSRPWENAESGTALQRYGHGFLWGRLRKESGNAEWKWERKREYKRNWKKRKINNWSRMHWVENPPMEYREINAVCGLYWGLSLVA